MFQKNQEEQNALNGVLETLEELRDALDTLDERLSDVDDLSIRLDWNMGEPNISDIRSTLVINSATVTDDLQVS